MWYTWTQLELRNVHNYKQNMRNCLLIFICNTGFTHDRSRNTWDRNIYKSVSTLVCWYFTNNTIYSTHLKNLSIWWVTTEVSLMIKRGLFGEEIFHLKMIHWTPSLRDTCNLLWTILTLSCTTQWYFGLYTAGESLGEPQESQSCKKNG